MYLCISVQKTETEYESASSNTDKEVCHSKSVLFLLIKDILFFIKMLLYELMFQD